MVAPVRQIRAAGLRLEVRTLRLTKKLFKQLPAVTVEEFRALVRKGGDGVVAGWVSGAVLNDREEFRTWLVLRTGPGQFAKYDTIRYFRAQFPQLYVA